MGDWLAQRQDDRRAWRWLWISIALHLPLTPLGPLFGLVVLLTRCSEPPASVEELRGIPIELLEEAPAEPQPHSEVEETTPSDILPEPAIERPKKPKPRAHDDDAPDAGVETDDAGAVAVLDASVAVTKLEDAGADAGVAVAQGQSAEEGLAAATHGIADSNANVRLNIYMVRVRRHPLSANLGELLKSIYQWREFFASGGLDPVKDFDQIMLLGPQFSDSSQVAAFLQHNVRAPRMKRAVDALVKQSGNKGEWLKDSKYPTAHAHADRAERSFIMYPGQVVAVLPPNVEKDALALPSFKLPKPNGDELVSAFVKYPAGPLSALGFQLSKSIRSATIKVFAEVDGGVRVEMVLEDANTEAAQKDAKQIRRDIDSITLASNWLLSKSRFAEPVQADVSGNKINLVLKVTGPQAERVFNLASSAMTPEGRHAVKEAMQSRMADAGAPKTASAASSGNTGVAGPEKPNSTPPPVPVPPPAPVPNAP